MGSETSRVPEVCYFGKDLRGLHAYLQPTYTSMAMLLLLHTINKIPHRGVVPIGQVCYMLYHQSFSQYFHETGIRITVIL